MTIWERIKYWFIMTFLSIDSKPEEYQEVYSEMQRIRKEHNLP